MPSVPDDPTELSPEDLLDEDSWTDSSEKSTVARGRTGSRAPASLPKPPVESPRVSQKPTALPKSIRPNIPSKAPAKGPPVADAPAMKPPLAAAAPWFPDIDATILEARRRAEASGGGDRISLSRARTELAILLEVLKRDVAGALAEYRAAHAISSASLAPIAGARRLTPRKPIAPALALLEAELRATSDPPARAVRLLELGRLLALGGSAPEKSCQAYRDVLAIEPDHPGALRGLESALWSTPRSSDNAVILEAIAAHLQAMSASFAADRKLAAWLEVERAGIFEKLRRPGAARAALEAAIELSGEIGPVRDAYVRHLILHKDMEGLVKAWAGEAGMEQEPARAARLFYAAGRLASERLDRAPLAIELHRRAASIDGAPPDTRRAALTGLARLYRTAGDAASGAAAEEWLLGLSDAEELAYRHRRLAKTYESLERWEDVARHAAEALRLDPDDEEVRERLDGALARLSRHEERMAIWTAEASRLTAVAARAEAFLRAARIAENDLARPDAALTELRAAWAVDPSNVEVTDSIARLLTPGVPPNPTDPDDPARARARIDFYREAAAAAPDLARKVALLEKLALIWEDEVRAPGFALDVYKEIVELEPARRGAVLGLQRSAARAGQPQELFRALVLEAEETPSPQLERTLFLRAAEVASEKLNDADTALDLVKRVLGRNAGDPLALRAACRIHVRTGRYEEAVSQLRLLLQHTRRGPASAAIQIEIAGVFEDKLRRRDEALACYREAYKIDPANPVPLAEIRRILLAATDYRAVAEELASMAANVPGPEARGRLLVEAAEIFDDRLDDPERALSLLTQARPLLAGHAGLRDRLERAYARLGKVGDLITFLDQGPDKDTPRVRFALGSLLAEDRDLVRAASVLTALLADDPGHVPALRTLEHVLRRTERWQELGAVLRLQATKFETPDARIGALHELVVLEEDYGVHPKPGETAAADLLAAAVPEEPRIHEARLAKNGLVLDGAIAPSLLSTSISILAASTTDAHLAASLQLAAALLLERSASENEHEKLGDALRRYHLALEGWPECLTAARGMRRLAERLGEGEALIEAAAALGNLETTSQARAERLIEAGTALAARGVTLRRAQDLFSRALAEDPDSARAAEGLIGLLSVWAEPGQAADALRAALDRTTVPEQAVRLGVGLARLAIDQLRDPTVALEALRRVRKKAPGHVPSLLSLAEACASLKLWTETAEAATGALGITRDAGERLRGSVLLAEAHAQVADTRSAARRETAEAEKLADGSPEALRSSLFSRIASIHRTLGDPAGAERALVRAVVYGPEDPAPMRALEELHPISLRDGALAHARALEQVLALAESLGIRREGAWLSALGRIEASALSRPREGLARIREAIRVSPARTESYELLTEVYGVLGAHDDAVRELVGLLGEATPASASPERALTILRLVVRECKLSRRPLQAATAEELIAYISRAIGPPGAELEGTIVPRAKPIAATVPAALSLSRASIESHLIPAEGRGPALELCTALSEVVPKLLRIDPFALGLSQRDRLEKRAPHPLRMIADRFARAFGDLRFDLYVDASSVSAPRLLPGDPAVIVLPRGYGDLSENEQAIGLSRLFVYLTLDVPWFDELGADDLDGLLVGARRVADERWGEGALSSVRAASAELWRPRIAKGASRKLKRTLEELAPRLPNFDPAAVRQALRIASFRGAYVLTGDIVTTLNHVLRVDRDLAAAAKGQRIHKMLEHPVTQDLLLYALSELPAGIRRQIGSA